MVGERFAPAEQLGIAELVHLLIGAIMAVLALGMVNGWITRFGIIGTGIVAGVLIIAAFVMDQHLREQLQEAHSCSCISCTGDGS